MGIFSFLCCCFKKNPKKEADFDEIDPRLEKAQQSAKKKIEKANGIREKRSKCTSGSKKCREYKEKDISLRKEASEIVRKANLKAAYLDLHYMLLEDARKLMIQKVQSYDRPLRKRGDKKGPRSIRIVTGYGKTTGSSVIKPAVESWLASNGYDFEHLNPGAIIVQCK